MSDGWLPDAAYRLFADRDACSRHQCCRPGHTRDENRSDLRTDPARDADTVGRARLRAVGTGYVALALDLLTATLDHLVVSGAMPPEQRPQADFLAWSAAHGFALLLIDGPLRALPRKQTGAVTRQLIDMVEAGFTCS